MSSLPLLANLFDLIFTVSQLVFILFDLLLYHCVFIFTLISLLSILLFNFPGQQSFAALLPIFKAFYLFSLRFFPTVGVGRVRLEVPSLSCLSGASRVGPASMPQPPAHTQPSHSFQVPFPGHCQWHMQCPCLASPLGSLFLATPSRLTWRKEVTHSMSTLDRSISFLQGRGPSFFPLYVR